MLAGREKHRKGGTILKLTPTLRKIKTLIIDDNK